MCIHINSSTYNDTYIWYAGAEIGTSVMESYAFDYLDAPMERVSGADVPMPYANNLEKQAIPTSDNIVSAARRACFRKAA